MRAVLALRSLFFVILMPGVVVGYIPYRIARPSNLAQSIEAVPAVVVVLAGVAILLMCVWEFFARGKGTLAPIDPPTHLVVTGLYRHTRNPMYNGVVLALLGEAWLFRSPQLLVYAVGVFVAAHLFVVLYEEPALQRRFGDEYRAYRAAVPRWGATRHAYDTAAR